MSLCYPIVAHQNVAIQGPKLDTQRVQSETAKIFHKFYDFFFVKNLLRIALFTVRCLIVKIDSAFRLRSHRKESNFFKMPAANFLRAKMKLAALK